MKEYSEERVSASYRRLTKLLIEKDISITTMESATSGYIASLITDTEGASAILKGALITYSNEAKIMAGVPAEIIDRYSVYSRETARAMASACRRQFGACIGIGVTGTMGNVDPVNAEASVPGQVYFAIDRNGEVLDYSIELAPQPSRRLYKAAVAQEVVDVLEAMLPE